MVILLYINVYIDICVYYYIYNMYLFICIYLSKILKVI